MTSGLELAGVLSRLRAELDARNADNVTRTRSYLELYTLTRETEADWPWLLMAHLVSRNAGYLMVDVAIALEHEKRFFSREALIDLFVFLERANFLIFFDAWHHVLGALAGSALEGDERTPLHMQRAYASYFERAARGIDAAAERALVFDLVENEQNYIERRVVHHPAFHRGLALVTFFESVRRDAPLVLPRSSAEIRVGEFAKLDRRIAVGQRIFDEVLADRVQRAEIHAWALEHPHTGSRAIYGGKSTFELGRAWPVERVRALAPHVHDDPEPDAGWP